MEAAPKRVLTPAAPREIVSNDGGSYYAWNSDDLSMLAEARIGASKLYLNPRGFALPYYSDSSKVAYVLQGSGVAGIVLPEKPEEVIKIRAGDSVAVPFGVINWYFNNGSEDLEILFLGDTSKAHRAGQFTDFPLAGASALFHGFSKDFVSRAWDLSEAEVDRVLNSQGGTGIVKLKEGVNPFNPAYSQEVTKEKTALAFNCLDAPLDVDIKNGGRVVVLTGNNLPLLKDINLSADLVRIDAHSMCSPGYSSDSAYQVTYVLKGSGRVQVVGIDGESVLDTQVKPGLLFIVPRFHVVSKIAGDEGLQWFSIITTPNPVFTQLGGKTSAWKALSKETLMAAFDIDEETEKLFRSKRMQDAIFFPPPNASA
eukprot:TRINITY_DN22688_c0_g1_i1.p1 TRINITY_DN22688_c0_g1~~TRINITY_DN22688_c0_g1_i1.p1  ORF type:complete len:369 (+),score=56.30 TRINITY_DN22688_c0_g1_i1:96-1202(+)